MMTFRQLLLALNELSEEDLDKTATVYVNDSDTFYGVQYTETAFQDGVFSDTLDCEDTGSHPFIVIADSSEIETTGGRDEDEVFV